MIRCMVGIVLAGAAVAGCGGDEPPERVAERTTAPGADLRVDVHVRAGAEDPWRRRLTLPRGRTAEVRVRVANTGGRQASRLRGGVVLPTGLTYVHGTAAAYRVAPGVGTGDPVGQGFVGAGLRMRPLPAGDEIEFRLGVRATRTGAARVTGRVAGRGTQARDRATLRVRR